jgi:hypothetical protein
LANAKLFLFGNWKRFEWKMKKAEEEEGMGKR